MSNSFACSSALRGYACYGVFFNFNKAANYVEPSSFAVDCDGRDNFDPDIAGIGVVVSFCVTALLTSIAPIVALLLNRCAGVPSSLLPENWQSQERKSENAKELQVWQKVLERFILSLADQQLFTGYALLICQWISAAKTITLERQKHDYGALAGFPGSWIPTAQFNLVVFLCMASSSAHFSSVMVLKEFMKHHQQAARLRIIMIIIFSCFLAVTVALASSFATYSFSLAGAISVPLSGLSGQSFVLAAIISTAVPLSGALWMSWLCTMQLAPDFKSNLQRTLSRTVFDRLKRWLALSKIWHFGIIRCFSPKWEKRCTSLVKKCFWSVLLGDEQILFVVQFLLAILSLVWIGLQRLSGPPIISGVRKDALCSFKNVAPDSEMASFGQLLPIILLLLPIYSLYSSYLEEKDNIQNGSLSLAEGNEKRRPKVGDDDEARQGLLSHASGTEYRGNMI